MLLFYFTALVISNIYTIVLQQVQWISSSPKAFMEQDGERKC